MAIDTLSFTFDLLLTNDEDDIEDPPTQGVYIVGLYMEGCKWDGDNNVLVDSDPGILFVNSPIIHFLPYEDYTPDSENYLMPVY